jgi:hypothetical protein
MYCCFNTRQYKHNINTAYWLVLACIQHANTCQYMPIQAQYNHDGAETRDRWRCCIGMYWYVLCMYCACICLYWSVLGGSVDHGFPPRSDCLYCMYWYVFVCIEHVLCMYCVRLDAPIQTNTSISTTTNQYKHNTITEILYVLI